MGGGGGGYEVWMLTGDCQRRRSPRGDLFVREIKETRLGSDTNRILGVIEGCLRARSNTYIVHLSAGVLQNRNVFGQKLWWSPFRH